MTGTTRKAGNIKVAAIQMSVDKGNVRKNLEKAAAMIEQAAGAGAQLIVLPECAATGYAIERSMWDYAEPVDGPTVKWLADLSKRLGVYIGIGLVEAEGEDFYNSYVLAGPEGRVVGRVRKQRTEFNIFRKGDTPRVIDAPFGRIGLAICADNHYSDLPEMMQAASIDIMLMPHALPAPLKTSKLVNEKDVREAAGLVRGYAELYVRMLGVPVIFVNQVGPITRGWEGILGKLIDPDVFGYAGFSTIADSDGAVKARMGLEEGFIASDVTLDPARKLKVKPDDYGGWLHPGVPLMRKVILPLGIASAKLKYALSTERRKKARAAAAK